MGSPAHAGIDRDTGKLIVSPVARSRAAMMVCRSQPTKQVTSSPPWSRS